MPPRKATKRARRGAAPPAPTPTATTTDGRNATADLPVEIYLEIISYFRSVPIDDMHGGYHLDSHLCALERQDALLAMSQTCRVWRAFFRPLLWENVEMAGTRHGGGQWFKQCADTLVAKCTELAETPEVAKYVKGMRFVLSTHDMALCLEVLARAMKACANLKTVHVYFAQTDSAKMIKAAFDGHVFPSVEKVILPSQAHAVLRCCPNVKEVVNFQGDGSQIVTAMQAKCKKVEVLTGVCPDMAMAKRLVKAGSNIRELRFTPGNRVPYASVLEQLGPLKNLRAIQLTCSYNIEQEKVESYFVQHMAALKKVVHNCTVTMKPFRWYGYHANSSAMADPGHDYEHKVYIK